MVCIQLNTINITINKYEYNNNLTTLKTFSLLSNYKIQYVVLILLIMWLLQSQQLAGFS